MTMIYNDPAGGSDSSVGEQFRTDYYYKKALVDAAKEAYFGQLANVRAMPKNMGKTIKQYHYLPILDDRNINDQGIDANGVAFNADASTAVWATVVISAAAPEGNETLYFVGRSSNIDYSVALTDAMDEAQGNVLAYFLGQGFNTLNDTFLEFVDAAWDGGGTGTAATGGPGASGWDFLIADAGTEGAAVAQSGNLYGSSKDVGMIPGKLPTLSETGGRVNRVGMKRIALEGSIAKFGFFDEYTQEALDFDSDSELEMHITQETVKAANEITEDQLQIDLLTQAGVVRFAGDATSTATLLGGTTRSTCDVVSYDDLIKLGIELDNNRCPKNTTIIAGSRMVDTKVVNAARYMYIGSELIPAIMQMTDYHSERAFIPVAQYANAGNVARGEFGAIGDIRLIVVPEMMKWEAAGAAVGDVDGGELMRWSYDGTTNAHKHDVFPMLVVGSGSFATIGFQTDGKTVKFTINHKRPAETVRPEDPYGEVGFYSIKWYYGFMVLRPEWIAVLKTLADI